MSEDRSHFSRYRFLEHEADVGVRGEGDCWECAFAAGALGLLEIMAEPSSVRDVEERHIELRREDIGGLFVAWLNEMVCLRDVEGLLFRHFDVDIEEDEEGGYVLRATARGETLSQERHDLRTEVKAATLSGLKFGEEEGVRFVQCLLDV